MRILFFALFLFSAVLIQAQEDISKYLYDLPDIQFEKIDPLDDGYSSYLLMIKQPIDHNDLTKGHFQQKVYLNHLGLDQLNVMATEGYAANRNRPPSNINASRLALAENLYLHIRTSLSFQPVHYILIG